MKVEIRSVFSPVLSGLRFDSRGTFSRISPVETNGKLRSHYGGKRIISRKIHTRWGPVKAKNALHKSARRNQSTRENSNEPKAENAQPNQKVTHSGGEVKGKVGRPWVSWTRSRGNIVNDNHPHHKNQVGSPEREITLFRLLRMELRGPESHETLQSGEAV